VWLALTSMTLFACSGETAKSGGAGSSSSSTPSATRSGSTSTQTGDTSVAGCMTTGSFRCDPSAAQQIPQGPAVTAIAAGGPIPQSYGGNVTPGNYVLTGVTLYGSAPPNFLSTAPGSKQSAALTVSCDQYNEVYGIVASSGSGGGNACGRLVPGERALNTIVQSNDPIKDGTPYTSTADTLDLIDLQPYQAGQYVLGEYAVVQHFTLVGTAGAPPPQPVDASTPPPINGRDRRCPVITPTNDTSCDPSVGPLECEYAGFDPDHLCTTLAACALAPPSPGFVWALTNLNECGGTNDPSCPASLAAAQALPSPSVSPGDGGPAPECESDGSFAPTVMCRYSEAACSCVVQGVAIACACLSGADVASSSGGQCPTRRPLAGDACTVEGAQCGYSPPCGSVSLGPSMTCVDGHWIQFEEFAGCPAVGCLVVVGH
jgi:hypothetical protein